jgi:hypothetical protein
MWGSRLRSALFIDFENIGSRMSPAALRAMTAWLEDGRFDEAGRKRRVVAKRVYWNSSAERHRDTRASGKPGPTPTWASSTIRA